MPCRVAILLGLTAVLVVGGCAGGPAAQPGPAAREVERRVELVVVALGLPVDAEGSVAFALYDSADSFEGGGEPLRRGFVAVAGGEARWSVDDLPAGGYAVKAYFDANGNGRLDTNPLGRPTEPYGFSNDARGRFGPPGFAAARFAAEGGGRVLEILLQ